MKCPLCGNMVEIDAFYDAELRLACTAHFSPARCKWISRRLKHDDPVILAINELLAGLPQELGERPE